MKANIKMRRCQSRRPLLCIVEPIFQAAAPCFIDRFHISAGVRLIPCLCGCGCLCLDQSGGVLQGQVIRLGRTEQGEES